MRAALEDARPTRITPRCPGPDAAHKPTQKSFKKGGGRKYYLFAAASAGCLDCVKRLVLEEGVDPKSTSDSCKYTAVSFAEWSLQQGAGGAEGCRRVINFLQSGAAAGTISVSSDTHSGLARSSEWHDPSDSEDGDEEDKEVRRKCYEARQADKRRFWNEDDSDSDHEEQQYQLSGSTVINEV